MEERKFRELLRTQQEHFRNLALQDMSKETEELTQEAEETLPDNKKPSSKEDSKSKDKPKSKKK